MSILAQLAFAGAEAERKAKHKPSSQDMERKKLKMREYYQKNRDTILTREKSRSKAKYHAHKRAKELDDEPQS